MKRLFIAILFVLILFSTSFAEVIDIHGRAAIFFSPNGGATDAAVQVINSAKTRIYVQAYVLSSEPIINALIDAKKRNLDVQIILDKGHNTDHYLKYTNALNDVGIPCYIDGKPRIAHSKVMIIDDDYLITGSFNFTKSAEENNAENMIIFKCPEIVVVYLNNFKNRLSKSVSYVKKTTPTSSGVVSQLIEPNGLFNPVAIDF